MSFAFAAVQANDEFALVVLRQVFRVAKVTLKQPFQPSQLARGQRDLHSAEFRPGSRSVIRIRQVCRMIHHADPSAKREPATARPRRAGQVASFPVSSHADRVRATSDTPFAARPATAPGCACPGRLGPNILRLRRYADDPVGCANAVLRGRVERPDCRVESCGRPPLPEESVRVLVALLPGASSRPTAGRPALPLGRVQGAGDRRASPRARSVASLGCSAATTSADRVFFAAASRHLPPDSWRSFIVVRHGRQT